MRLFRYVSALRTLALCIVSTIGSLIWTLVLLVLLFYTFGVILTQLVSDHCRDQVVMTTGDVNAVPQCTDDLQRYWASVPESMLTLFLAISGGMSWEDAFGPLRTASELACAFMILYIVIAVFAVLNVVTGVFCTTAIESANADKDVAAIKQLPEAMGVAREQDPIEGAETSHQPPPFFQGHGSQQLPAHHQEPVPSGDAEYGLRPLRR